MIAARALVVIACVAACSRTPEPPPPPPPIAQVGELTITAEMLAQRRRQIDMYYPGQSSREGALAQLVQGYLAVEILRREGIVLDRTTWLAERDRIERQTRDRDRLERIKALYDGDEDAYLRVGILPDFARSRLERHHPDDFGAWFEAQARTIPVTIHDPTLRSSR